MSFFDELNCALRRMSLQPLATRRVSKEDILAGESPGLFWTVDEPTGLTKEASTEEGRSRRTSAEEMFKSSILAGHSPAKGGEDFLVPALPAEETVLQHTLVLDKVSTQKASKWARVRDEVLSGQSPGLFWMPPDESGPLKAKKGSTQKASKWAQVREEILSGQFWLSEKLSEGPTTAHVRPRSRGLRRALKVA
jgi:hypothetical protein